MSKTETELFCGPCAVSRKKSKSTSWCMQCEEGLCAECLDHHKRMKLSRNHTTIDANQYEKLPSFIHDIQTNCSEHKRQMELYCPLHKVACCVQCIALNHPKCLGMTSLETVASSAKSSTTIPELERDLQELLEESEKIVRGRSNNMNRLIEEETRIKTEISSIRSKMNEHLDKLEEKISIQLETIKSSEISKIEDILRELNERREEMLKYKKDLKGIKIQATDLQTFYGIQHISTKVESNKAFMKILETSQNAVDVDLFFEQSPSVNLIMGKLTSFGKITTTVAPLKSATHPAVRSKSVPSSRQRSREISFKSGRTSLSTIPEVVNSNKEKDIRKMTLVLQKRISIPVGQLGIISSIARLNDKRIIVAESSYKNGHLFLFNAGCRFLREIRVPGDPWDITQLDDTNIAVTYPDEKSIKFINCLTNAVVDTIPLDKSGWGISTNDGTIYVGLKGHELRELDFYGNKISSSNIKSRLENFHILSDRIYYTDSKKNLLNCASLTGEIIWTHQNEYMKGPQSVTTDKYGNIFVVCEDSHCVLVISPDRNKIRFLIGKSAGLERPTAMFCDQENSILLVTNRNGKFAGMFKIVYR